MYTTVDNLDLSLQNIETRQHAHNSTKYLQNTENPVDTQNTEFGFKITEYKFGNKEYSETGQHAHNCAKYLQNSDFEVKNIQKQCQLFRVHTEFGLKCTEYRIYRKRAVGSEIYRKCIVQLYSCCCFVENWKTIGCQFKVVVAVEYTYLARKSTYLKIQRRTGND